MDTDVPGGAPALYEGERPFRGKPLQREIYIIREYEIKEDKAACQQPQQFPEQQEIQSQRKSLPNNVVPINRKR